MALGRPAIAPVKDLAIRPVAAAISAARQRIEALDAAVTALQALPTTSAAQITQLQAQISALVASSAALGLRAANLVYAGPTSGAPSVPTFRSLLWADLPLLSDLSAPSGALEDTDLLLFERSGTRHRTTVADVRAALTWSDVPADHTLTATDAGNGLATSGNSGVQFITVPGEDVAFPTGGTVLLAQEGAADVFVLPVSGVQVLYRSGLSLQLGGQFAVAWLTKRAADTWFLYGDLMP